LKYFPHEARSPLERNSIGIQIEMMDHLLLRLTILKGNPWKLINEWKTKLGETKENLTRNSEKVTFLA